MSTPPHTAVDGGVLHDSPLPGGLHGSILLVALTCILCFWAPIPFFMDLACTVVLTVGMLGFNFIPSRFQHERRRFVSSKCTVILPRLLIGVPWPLARVLLYPDGIELRLLFQRYFIPYSHTGPPKNIFMAIQLPLLKASPFPANTLYIQSVVGPVSDARMLKQLRVRRRAALSGEES